MQAFKKMAVCAATIGSIVLGLCACSQLAEPSDDVGIGNIPLTSPSTTQSDSPSDSQSDLHRLQQAQVPDTLKALYCPDEGSRDDASAIRGAGQSLDVSNSRDDRIVMDGASVSLHVGSGGNVRGDVAPRRAFEFPRVEHSLARRFFLVEA